MVTARAFLAVVALSLAPSADLAAQKPVHSAVNFAAGKNGAQPMRTTAAAGLLKAFDAHIAAKNFEALGSAAVSLASEPSPCVGAQKIELLRKIEALPPAEKQKLVAWLELADGEASKAALGAATRDGGHLALLEVAYRYPHTLAGAQAALLAATQLQAAGLDDDADMIFDRLYFLESVFASTKPDRAVTARPAFRALIAKLRSGRPITKGYADRAWGRIDKSLPLTIGRRSLSREDLQSEVAAAKSDSKTTADDRLLTDVNECVKNPHMSLLPAFAPSLLDQTVITPKFKSVVAGRYSGGAVSMNDDAYAWVHGTGWSKVALGSKVVGVFPGLHRSCAILIDGLMKCWDNTGRLLNDTPAGRVKNAIVASEETGAHMEDDSLRCWGKEMPSDGTSVPKGKIKQLLPPTTFHTCAILAEGTLQCWGSTRAAVPKEKVTKVALTDLGGCAILENKTVRCWSHLEDYAPLGKVKDLVVGSGFVCALLEDESVRCSGDKQSVMQPVVKGRFSRIHGGNDHVCAVSANDRIQCWGAQPFAPKERVLQSQSSDTHFCVVLEGGNSECKGSFNEFTKMTGVQAITAGAYASCALRKDSTAWCWGKDLHPATPSPQRLACFGWADRSL